jgi:hypothetical protein
MPAPTAAAVREATRCHLRGSSVPWGDLRWCCSHVVERIAEEVPAIRHALVARFSNPCVGPKTTGSRPGFVEARNTQPVLQQEYDRAALAALRDAIGAQRVEI